MNLYNCIIVDDEPIARDIIQAYCAHLPTIEVVASCSNALEARKALQQYKTDIVFLDINMPVLDGIAFLKTVKNRPQIIFTTAYKEYAVDAFELAAVDYLLKPFSLERFIIAIDKALERINKTSLAINRDIPEAKTEEYLFVKTDGKIFRIAYNDIVLAEASGNYTKIITAHQTLMPGITLTGFEQQLPSSIFIRVHRSFIINKSHITHIEGNRVYVDSIEIPIGSNYKEFFLKEIGAG